MVMQFPRKAVRGSAGKMLSAILGLAVVSQCCVAQGAPAQPLPTRQQFLFHIYVDPLFGDDLEATRLKQRAYEALFRSMGGGR